VEPQQTGRRGGGRDARRAKRADSGPSRAVGPGISGGSYRPLSDHDVARIHQTTLDVLEEVGMGDPPAAVRDLALAAGCRINERGRLCFPRALVEDTIAGAGRNFVLHGRDEKYDLQISGTRVHYGASGVAVLVPDFETGRYRPSTILDLYDFARLVDVLENVHFFNRPVIGRDIADPSSTTSICRM
jgi:trimethylamine--corrinoid protein Co-methyltransferase